MQAKLRTGEWELLREPGSAAFKFFNLPELAYSDNSSGKLDKITLSCVGLLLCKDDDYQNSNKHAFFKQLSRDISIKYLIEKMVRISTILIYGRLKDFNINSS